MNQKQEEIVKALLERHGRTYAAEANISLDRATPAPLFQLLTLSILLSARIRADAAVSAARGLFDAGLTTVDKMADASWEERTRILNQSGYARYDESTSRMLGETAGHARDEWAGDLRNLRQEAERDPGRERKLLKEFKGLGDVGVSIFFREVQGIWDELFPFADDRVLETAEALALPHSAEDLADLVSRQDMPRLTAALVRTRLAADSDEILADVS